MNNVWFYLETQAQELKVLQMLGNKIAKRANAQLEKYRLRNKKC